MPIDERVGAPNVESTTIWNAVTASTVRESIAINRALLAEGAQIILADSIYDACRKMTGNTVPSPALVVIGTDVFPAEVQVFPSTAGDSNYTFGSARVDLLRLVRFEGNRNVNGFAWSPQARSLGLVIYATGDLTATSGTIRMRKGGMGPIPTTALKVDKNTTVSLVGANGGAAPATGIIGNVGSAGAGQQCGGGGSGGGGSGSVAGGLGGAGAVGCCWCGGPGGGAGAYAEPGHAGVTGALSGTGGDGSYPSWLAAGGGGGAGVVGGAGSDNRATGQYVNAGEPGTSGTGGLLILMCEGNFNNAGTIDCDGSIGGRGGTGAGMGGQGPGSGGGGSGGGILIILRKGSHTNSGTLRANGGAAGPIGPVAGGGAAAVTGGAGGAGTVTTGVLAA